MTTTAVVIPCAAGDTPNWTQRTSLGGQDYVLSFAWSQRESVWRLQLADQDGSPIWSGVLVVGLTLLRRVVDSRRPVGELVFLDTLAADEEATYSSLGTRHVLYYVEGL